MMHPVSQRSRVDLAAERGAFHLHIPDFAVDDPDDDLAFDTAEICRKIEHDGMIGLDGAPFDDE